MFVISISGGSGSGKSSVAKQLAKRLVDASVIHMDSFYIDRPHSVSHDDYNYDSPDSLDLDKMYDSIQKLLSGKKITIPEYDYTISSKKGSIEILPSKYLILEGLFCLYNSPIFSLTNYSVFLECDLDVLLSRRIIRDVELRKRDAEYVIGQYFKFTRPGYFRYVHSYREIADVVIQNCMGRTVEDAAEIIASNIERIYCK